MSLGIELCPVTQVVIPLRRSQGIWDKAMPMLPAAAVSNKLYQRRRYDMPLLDCGIAGNGLLSIAHGWGAGEPLQRGFKQAVVAQ